MENVGSVVDNSSGLGPFSESKKENSFAFFVTTSLLGAEIDFHPGVTYWALIPLTGFRVR